LVTHAHSGWKLFRLDTVLSLPDVSTARKYILVTTSALRVSWTVTWLLKLHEPVKVCSMASEAKFVCLR
jgi:hypothetical protein